MKKLLLYLLVCFSSTYLFSQSTYASFNVNVYEPLATMGDYIDELPVGISMGLYKTSENSPITFGLETGLAVYNCEEDIVSHKGQDIPVYRDDHLFTLHGVMRYTVVDVAWSEMYGEGRIGMTTFFTSTAPTECVESDYNGSLDYHGTAFNVGLGGGILLNPTIFSGLDEDSPYRIDIGVTSIGGTNSSYSVIQDQENSQDHERTTANSFTNYMSYRIGFVIKL